jgi:hypothetical protein
VSRLLRPTEPDASSPAAVGGLVAANLLPFAGVLWFGWGVFDVLAVYWVESGVVGALNVPKILLARGRGEGDPTFTATVNGRPVDLSGPDESALVDGPHVYAANVPVAAFFVSHYGVFWAVHGVFVLFGLPAFAGTAAGVDASAALLGGVAMLASHGGSFLVNFVGREEYRDVSAATQMSAPYRRVFVLHLTIVGGAFLVVSLGSPVVLVGLLVALKTGFDVVAHLREHRRVERGRSADEAGGTV